MFFFFNPIISLTKEYCSFLQEASKGELRDMGGWVLNLKVKYIDSVFLGLQDAGLEKYKNHQRDRLGNKLPSFHPKLPKEVLEQALLYIRDYIKEHKLEEISIIDVARFLVMSGVIHFYGELKYNKNFHKIDRQIHDFEWLFKKNPHITVTKI